MLLKPAVVRLVFHWTLLRQQIDYCSASHPTLLLAAHVHPSPTARLWIIEFIAAFSAQKAVIRCTSLNAALGR